MELRLHLHHWERFTELRGRATPAAHLVFGIATARSYWKLARRGASGPRAA